MSSPTILNADMRTIGGWLRDFWRWWSDELSGLFGRGAVRAAPVRPVAMANEKGQLAVHMPDGGSVPARPGAMRSADIALAEEQALEREVRLPAMSARDMRNYLDLEADRYFPLPGGALLHDAIVIGGESADGLQLVKLCAIRRDLVERIVADALAAEIKPLRIGIAPRARAVALRYDFAQQLRAEGALPKLGVQKQLWWGVVAGLALLNIALLVWRDQASVDRLQALVDAQQPAVRIYRTLAERNARAEALAGRTLARRASRQPLRDLALITDAMPTVAWVQRYDWTGRAVRLSGYYQGEADPLTALRKVPRLASAHASGTDTQADIPIGHPYEIAIDLDGPR